jgi:hypothetical protein
MIAALHGMIRQPKGHPFPASAASSKNRLQRAQKKSTSDFRAGSSGTYGKNPFISWGFEAARLLLLMRQGTRESLENARKAEGQKACKATGQAAAKCGRSRQHEIAQPAATAAGADVC